jgi:hypothetical protein
MSRRGDGVNCVHAVKTPILSTLHPYGDWLREKRRVAGSDQQDGPVLSISFQLSAVSFQAAKLRPKEVNC